MSIHPPEAIGPVTRRTAAGMARAAAELLLENNDAASDTEAGRLLRFAADLLTARRPGGGPPPPGIRGRGRDDDDDRPYSPGGITSPPPGLTLEQARDTFLRLSEQAGHLSGPTPPAADVVGRPGGDR